MSVFGAALCATAASDTRHSDRLQKYLHIHFQTDVTRSSNSRFCGMSCSVLLYAIVVHAYQPTSLLHAGGPHWQPVDKHPSLKHILREPNSTDTHLSESMAACIRSLQAVSCAPKNRRHAPVRNTLGSQWRCLPTPDPMLYVSHMRRCFPAKLRSLSGFSQGPVRRIRGYPALSGAEISLALHRALYNVTSFS